MSLRPSACHDVATFLHPLACSADDERIARAATSAGSQYPQGSTVLHFVARQCLLEDFYDLQDGGWVEFAKAAILNDCPISSQDVKGSTPLTSVLRRCHWCRNSKERTTILRNWARILRMARVDLLEYGRHEITLSANHRVEGQTWAAGDDTWALRSRPERTIRSVRTWTFGPCVNDWAYQIRNSILVPVSELQRHRELPGAWAQGILAERPLIAWLPHADDYPADDYTWRLQRTLAIPCGDEEHVLEDDSDEDTGSETGKGLLRTYSQDDAGEVTLLLSRTRGHDSRRRAASRPAPLGRNLAGQRFFQAQILHWALHCGVHVCNGRYGLNHAGFPWSKEGNARRCAKCAYNAINHEGFRQRTRRFQYKYNTLEELRQLPYAAYR